jgi:hypothetical protein
MCHGNDRSEVRTSQLFKTTPELYFMDQDAEEKGGEQGPVLRLGYPYG